MGDKPAPSCSLAAPTVMRKQRLCIAQAAMRHPSLALTMNAYTGLGLLDVAGALEALPDLTLGGETTANAQGAAK